ERMGSLYPSGWEEGICEAPKRTVAQRCRYGFNWSNNSCDRNGEANARVRASCSENGLPDICGGRWLLAISAKPEEKYWRCSPHWRTSNPGHCNQSHPVAHEADTRAQR